MEPLDLTFLPGVYELVKIITDDNGTWINQSARGGMATFTIDGKLVLVNGPDATNCIAYQGTYRVSDRRLEISVKVCNMPEIEGRVIFRTILFLDPECLILETDGARSGRRSRLTWKKIAYLNGRAHH